MHFLDPQLAAAEWHAVTGLRASRGEGDAIAEYFKPGESPDDGSSFLGFEQVSFSGGDDRSSRRNDPYTAQPPPRRQPSGGLFGTW